MPGLQVSRRLSAPPERVWALLTDFERAHQVLRTVKRVEKLSEGPLGEGSRLRAVRVVEGREIVKETRIAEWDPPRRLVLLIGGGGMSARNTIDLEADGEGTLVRLSVRLGALSIVLLPLTLMVIPKVRQVFEDDLEDLEKALAAPGAASGSG